VGILGTAYNLLQIPANVIWGKVSDRYGRKQVLVFGQLALAASTVALGLAKTLPTALVARSLSGMLNGNVAVAAAAISDVTAVKDRPRAFSLLGFVFSLAFALGPLVGSFLARPVEWDPIMRGTLFEKYPYLLACVTASLIALVGATAAACVLDPPRHKPPPLGAPPPAAATDTTPDRAALPARTAPDRSRPETLGVPLLDQGGTEDSSSTPASGGGWTLYPRTSTAADFSPHSAPLVLTGPPPTIITLDAAAPLSDPPPPAELTGSFASLCAAHFGFGFLVAGGAELFPLFASAPSPDGLGWSTNQVGTALCPLAAGLFAGAYSFPIIARKYGAVVSFRWAVLFFFGSNLLIPQLRSFVHFGTPTLWAAVLVISVIRSLGGPLGFPALGVMLNAVLTKDVGFWNGIASSSLAAGRSAAPLIVGSVWSLTLLHDGSKATRYKSWPYPVDYHLAFYIMCCVSLVNVALSLFFPRPAAPRA
jgi:MFS family permease